LTDFIKRYQLIAYFVFTYAFSWGLWIPVQQFVLDGYDVLIPLIILGIFGPAFVSIGLSAILNPSPKQGNRKNITISFISSWIISLIIYLINHLAIGQIAYSPMLVAISAITALLPAYIVSSIYSPIPGIREHLATYIPTRENLGYYLFALLFIPSIWLLGMFMSRGLGMRIPNPAYAIVDVRSVGMIFLIFSMNAIHGGLSEEPGWRGFALPRLQGRFSSLTSSIILGVLWAIWHAPARFGGIEAKTLEDTLIEWVLILFVTVIITWFYNRTKGSILVAALFHASMNTTGGFLPGSLGAIMLLIASMIFLVFKDKMWRKLPPGNPALIELQ
jgi:membrane protease YdiL (CAAX protease family)